MPELTRAAVDALIGAHQFRVRKWNVPRDVILAALQTQGAIADLAGVHRRTVIRAGVQPNTARALEFIRDHRREAQKPLVTFQSAVKPRPLPRYLWNVKLNPYVLPRRLWNAVVLFTRLRTLGPDRTERAQDGPDIAFLLNGARTLEAAGIDPRSLPSHRQKLLTKRGQIRLRHRRKQILTTPATASLTPLGRKLWATWEQQGRTLEKAYSLGLPLPGPVCASLLGLERTAFYAWRKTLTRPHRLLLDRAAGWIDTQGQRTGERGTVHQQVADLRERAEELGALDPELDRVLRKIERRAKLNRNDVALLADAFGTTAAPAAARNTTDPDEDPSSEDWRPSIRRG